LWEVGIVPTEDLKIHVKEVMSVLGENTENVSAEDVEAELQRFLEYGVPLSQAKQTVIKKHGGSMFSNGSSASLKRTLIGELEANQKSVKIIGKIISVNPKDITVKGQPRQIFYGLLRDESGTVPFTSWSELDVMKGDIVEVANAYTREWQGAIQLNLGDRTHVEKKDESVLPSDAFEPKKCSIKELYTNMGSVDITAAILEIEKKDVEVDGEQKKVFSGVLGDETGKAPFSAWNDFKLKKGDSIHIVGGIVKSWKGMPQISFDENVTVEKADKKIDVKSVPVRRLMMYEAMEQTGLFDVEVSGEVIEIQAGSGLILRCPECGRVLFNNECRTHGAVEGQPDIRLKCAVDDGTGTVSAIFDQGLSEQLLGSTLEECKEMSPGDLTTLIDKKMFAKRLILRGNGLRDQFGTTFIVREAHREEIDVKAEAQSLSNELGASE
jgi:replication factor A1